MSELDLIYWDREVTPTSHWVVRVVKVIGATVLVVVAGLVATVVVGTAIFFASLEAADKMGLL